MSDTEVEEAPAPVIMPKKPETNFLTDPGKRFVVVDNPPALPGCCALFRTADDEWFIDTRMNDSNLPGHRGAVYIGKRAFDEMAKLVDYLSPGQHKELSEYARVLEGRNHKLENELEKWRQVFDELDRMGMLGDGMRNRVSDLLTPNLPAFPADQLAPAETDSGEKADATDDSASDKSSSSEGSDDAPKPRSTRSTKSGRSKSSGAF